MNFLSWFRLKLITQTEQEYSLFSLPSSPSVGSLLETPCPFSPGTSPGTTSPIMPVMSPEAALPISPLELSRSDADFHTCNTGSPASITTCTPGPAFTTGLVICTTPTVTSPSGPTRGVGPTCITEATGHLVTSPVPVFNHGLMCTRGFAYTSSTETCAVSSSTTRPNISIASSPMSVTPLPDATSTTGPQSWEQTAPTPIPTCFSDSSCATGPVSSPTLLASLEQLAEKGDDTHLPQSLHQVTRLSYS